VECKLRERLWAAETALERTRERLTNAQTHHGELPAREAVGSRDSARADAREAHKRPNAPRRAASRGVSYRQPRIQVEVPRAAVDPPLTCFPSPLCRSMGGSGSLASWGKELKELMLMNMQLAQSLARTDPAALRNVAEVCARGDGLASPGLAWEH
jgi:hypothetical protein